MWGKSNVGEDDAYDNTIDIYKQSGRCARRKEWHVFLHISIEQWKRIVFVMLAHHM